jgi:hypothetical protein
LSGGLRRSPASKSISTSTIGRPGLSISQTCAPLGCCHFWIGSAAAAGATRAQASRLGQRAARQEIRKAHGVPSVAQLDGRVVPGLAVSGSTGSGLQDWPRLSLPFAE